MIMAVHIARRRTYVYRGYVDTSLFMVCSAHVAFILQLAGPTGTLTQSDTVNNQYNNNNDLSSSYNNNNSNSSSVPKSVRIQPGGRFPSQTAPARLGMWDDDNDEDKFLKVLLLLTHCMAPLPPQRPLLTA